VSGQADPLGAIVKRRTFGAAALGAVGATAVALPGRAQAAPATATSAESAPPRLPRASGPPQTPPPPQIGRLDVVHRFTGPIPTGVTVSTRGRTFVTFPRWEDPVTATLVEVVDGREIPYPNAEINRADPADAAHHFITIQSAVVDPHDRLWALDTGQINMGPHLPGGPKLVGIDLRTNKIFTTIMFSPDAVLPTTELNDVRFDLRHGAGTAFITDSAAGGPNAVIVVDLATGHARRRLNGHPSVTAEPGFLPVIEGQPVLIRKPGQPPANINTGSDGIAITVGRLWYTPLASRTLYSVDLATLANPGASDAQIAATVRNHGFKGMSDGLESDDRGRVYGGDLERNAIVRRRPDGRYETVVQSPIILWPDTLSVATDRHLYFTVNQLHRRAQYHNGQDLRVRPFALLRTPIDAGPARLR
jgi:sugar lactone lactonase YvrE